MIDAHTTIGAVTLNVADLGKMIAFYRDVVGLQVKEETAVTATLGTPGRTLVHLRYLANGRSPSRATGLYHLALRVPTRLAFANWFRHYVERETPHWQGASDHGVSEALYLTDPEENGVELYRDTPSFAWKVAADSTITIYSRRLDTQALLREADGAWTGISPATDMGHIHLAVSDLAPAKKFYMDALGFGLKTELPGSALFIAAGNYHHHLGFNTWRARDAPPKADDAYGMAQFEILFTDEGARAAAIKRLKQADYPLEIDVPYSTVRDLFNNLIYLGVTQGELS